MIEKTKAFVGETRAGGRKKQASSEDESISGMVFRRNLTSVSDCSFGPGDAREDKRSKCEIYDTVVASHCLIEARPALHHKSSVSHSERPPFTFAR